MLKTLFYFPHGSGQFHHQLNFGHLNFVPTVAAAFLYSSHVTLPCFHWADTFLFHLISKRRSLFSQEREGGVNAPSTEAISAEVTTNLKHLLWSESACSMHTPEVQHLNQQQSICFHSVRVTGNKAALAPCDGKLSGAGESWSFLHSKNCGRKKHLPVLPVLQV